MANPIIAARSPAVIELEAGEYYWCACGRSANQPYCDGSHKGTEFTPVKVSVSEKKTVALCRCKHSANQPFCDGTHSSV